MSHVIRAFLRNATPSLLRNKACTISNTSTFFKLQATRTLYAKTTLGLDGFESQRERTKQQMVNIEDKFREKMRDYSKDDSKNMIFTEDLKNMIHLADTEEDLKLAVMMMKKFNQQNKQLRFGSYVFGPVVMRLFHKFNKPDLALELFKSPEMTGFFDQLMSYQLLLDLLFENKHYQEILDVFPVIQDRQIEGTKFPKNIIVLVLAACYKLNSQQSLEFALNLWRQLSEAGHFPMRRACTFCAGLALNQKKPEIALEILSSTKNGGYTTVRNLKVAALVELGRIEDAFVILKSIIRSDEPDSTNHTFNKDVIECVKTAVEKSDSPDFTLEFNRLHQLFQKQGHISDLTLEEQLCSEIQMPPMMNKRQGFVRRDTYPQRIRNNNRYNVYNQSSRPGLKELV